MIEVMISFLILGFAAWGAGRVVFGRDEHVGTPEYWSMWFSGVLSILIFGALALMGINVWNAVIAALLLVVLIWYPLRKKWAIISVIGMIIFFMALVVGGILCWITS